MATIAAVYRNGVFEPTEPVTLAEGTRVAVAATESLEAKRAWFEANYPGVFGCMSDEDAGELRRLVERPCSSAFRC